MMKERFRSRSRYGEFRADHAEDPTRSFLTGSVILAAVIVAKGWHSYLPYVADVIGPSFMAIMTSKLIEVTGRFEGKRRTVLPFMSSLAVTSGFETAQKFDMWPGTFDPKDYFAYGVGALLWLAADVSINRYRMNRPHKRRYR